jgi:hypothetical protein
LKEAADAAAALWSYKQALMAQVAVGDAWMANGGGLDQADPGGMCACGERDEDRKTHQNRPVS